MGQPRDGDPRTSYAVYDGDEGTIQGVRVSYPIEATQEKMRRAGLPQRLIERLSFRPVRLGLPLGVQEGYLPRPKSPERLSKLEVGVGLEDLLAGQEPRVND